MSNICYESAIQFRPLNADACDGRIGALRRQKWAIVAGLVRDSDRASEIFRTLSVLLREGTLDGVVTASWTGEYDRFPDLLALMEEAGILLVECPQPQLKLSGHIFHQSRAVNLALDFVPDGADVLKLRPDLGGISHEMISRLQGLPLGEAALANGETSVFDRQVVVPSAILTAPFYINDVVVYGSKIDLRRIFNFDYLLQFQGSRLGPEQMLHGHSFSKAIPLFNLYFRVSDGLDHYNIDLVKEKVHRLFRTRFYLDVLAHYHLFLLKYYEIGFSQPSDESQSNQRAAMLRRTFPELLISPASETGIATNAGVNVGVALNMEVISALVSGNFRSDEIGDAYLAAVSRAQAGVSPLDTSVQLEADIQAYLEALSCLEHYVPILPSRIGQFRLRFHGGLDRPALSAKDTAGMAIEQEVNVLRRRIDQLNAELSLLAKERLSQ